ncbi:hypothetical protein HGRIS_011541 [Hohenbuehelia grisea]
MLSQAIASMLSWDQLPTLLEYASAPLRGLVVVLAAEDLTTARRFHLFEEQIMLCSPLDEALSMCIDHIVWQAERHGSEFLHSAVIVCVRAHMLKLAIPLCFRLALAEDPRRVINLFDEVRRGFEKTMGAGPFSQRTIMSSLCNAIILGYISRSAPRDAMYNLVQYVETHHVSISPSIPRTTKRPSPENQNSKTIPPGSSDFRSLLALARPHSALEPSSQPPPIVQSPTEAIGHPADVALHSFLSPWPLFWKKAEHLKAILMYSGRPIARDSLFHTPCEWLMDACRHPQFHSDPGTEHPMTLIIRSLAEWSELLPAEEAFSVGRMQSLMRLYRYLEQQATLSRPGSLSWDEICRAMTSQPNLGMAWILTEAQAILDNEDDTSAINALQHLADHFLFTSPSDTGFNSTLATMNQHRTRTTRSTTLYHPIPAVRLFISKLMLSPQIPLSEIDALWEDYALIMKDIPHDARLLIFTNFAHIFCDKAGATRGVRHLLEMAEEAQLVPGRECYISLAKAYARQGSSAHATGIINHLEVEETLPLVGLKALAQTESHRRRPFNVGNHGLVKPDPLDKHPPMKHPFTPIQCASLIRAFAVGGDLIPLLEIERHMLSHPEFEECASEELCGGGGGEWDQTLMVARAVWECSPTDQLCGKPSRRREPRDQPQRFHTLRCGDLDETGVEERRMPQRMAHLCRVQVKSPYSTTSTPESYAPDR